MEPETPDAGLENVCVVRGSVNLDEYFYVSHIVTPGETLSSTHRSTHVGGKGANQSIAIHRAGGIVDLYAMVGRDEAGGQAMGGLYREGLGIKNVRMVRGEKTGPAGGEMEDWGVGTGRAIIQVEEGGENSIILYPGANLSQHHELVFTTPQTIREHGRGYFPAAAYLLLQNEIHPNSLAYALENASRRGTQVVFNPSPMLDGAGVRGVRWEGVAWVIVNLGEARGVLRGLEEGGELGNVEEGTEPGEVVRRLRKHPRLEKTGVVCTLGAEGVLAAGPDLGEEVVYVPAIELRGDVRDTTGAGDCFAGYFVQGLMESRTLGRRVDKERMREVLRVCTVAAGMCCEKRGTIDSIPMRAEVEERMKELGI